MVPLREGSETGPAMKRAFPRLLAAASLAVALLSAGCAERRTATTAHKDLPNGATVMVRENRASEVASINVFVTDGAFMPTSGGVPPTLTIEANSFRVGERIIALGKAHQLDKKVPA